MLSVIKLGGSTVSTETNVFDFEYLKNLKQILEEQINSGGKFFIVLGGGYTSRMYRDLAKEAGINTDEDLHWIGTTVNVLHARLSRSLFGESADPDIIKFEDYYDGSDLRVEKGIKFGGGGRPGHSGDVDANLAAIKLGADTVYSLKNIDGVYTADPGKNPDATRLDKISWDQYFDIIGHKTEHEPGGNYPIDPVAAKQAKENNLKYVILAGNELGNFSKALKLESFTGTIVSN